MFDRLSELVPLFAPLLALTDAAPNEFPWGSVSATGLLGWYLWYNTRHGIPSLVDRHAENLKAVSEQWSKLLESQRKDHSEELARAERVRREDQERFVESLENVTSSINGLACQAAKHRESP